MGVLDFLLKPRTISPIVEKKSPSLLEDILFSAKSWLAPQTMTLYPDRVVYGKETPTPTQTVSQATPTPTSIPRPIPTPTPVTTPYNTLIGRQFGQDLLSPATRTLKGENSTFDPNAEYKNTDGSIDRGLFQINSNTFADFMKRKGNLLKQNGITSFNDMFDPVKNIAMAKIILDEQGWGAWHGAPEDLKGKK